MQGFLNSLFNKTPLYSDGKNLQSYIRIYSWKGALIMEKYPKDCSSRVVSTASRAMFYNHLNYRNWEFHEITGMDYGMDCYIESCENDTFKNNKVFVQIKGTAHIETYKISKFISYPIDTKTINYALNERSAFIVALVDVCNDNIYYVELHEYFINNSDKIQYLNNQDKMNIHFKFNNIINSDNDDELVELSKLTFKKSNNGRILKI